MNLQLNLETLITHFGKAIGTTDGTAEPAKQIMAKLESPAMGWSWVIYEAEFSGDDMLFFGRVNGFASELGYFTWGELEQVPDLQIVSHFEDFEMHM